MNIPHQYNMTEQDYLQSQTKHEFIDGEVFALVRASSVHGLISGNIHTALHIHLKGKVCRPYMNDMKVRIEENYYYPDVLVDCSYLTDDAYFAETPILIVGSVIRFDQTIR